MPPERPLEDERRGEARRPLRILMPSIVDPATHRGGAGATTRALLGLLDRPPLSAQVEPILAPSAGGKFHRLRQAASLAWSPFSPLPAKALFTYARRFRQEFARRLREREHALVLLNGADLLWLLPEIPPGVPCVVFAHNLEHQLYLSQINSVTPPWPALRRLLLRDQARLRDYELRGLSQAGRAVFLSSQDAASALAECRDLRALVLPPLFDYAPCERPEPRDEGGVLQIGFPANFDWWPNREGLRWFLREVFPYAGEGLRLHLFGEGSERVAPRHPRIVAHGFLPSVQDVWLVCDFFVCPIFSGGGVNVKLAEAVYNHAPVVASAFAARGLPLKPDPGIVLLDRAEDWVGFLRSPAAQAMRSRRVAPDLAGAFAAGTHAQAVQAFFREALQAAGLTAP
jgi:hypothetical protein